MIQNLEFRYVGCLSKASYESKEQQSSLNSKEFWNNRKHAEVA